MKAWTFLPISIIYFTTICGLIVLGYLSWRIPSKKGTRVFTFMMFALTVWVSAYILGISSNSFNTKLLLVKFEYLGIVSSIYLWLLFVLQYTQFYSRHKKIILIGLAIIPLFTLINILRAPNSNAIHLSYEINRVKNYSTMLKEYGGGFYLWVSYSYVSLIAGMAVLVVHIITMPNMRRKQVFLLVPASIVVVVANVLYVLGINPIKPFDPTPVSLSAVSILFIISIYRHKFLGVMPIAHHHVYKNMRSGLIILDSNNEILEVNSAAENILNRRQKELIGKLMANVVPEFKDLVQSCKNCKELKKELIIGPDLRTFELEVNSIIDNYGKTTGKVVLLYDITEKKEAINELDAYARTVAHDLKNPLNSILWLVNVLKLNDEIADKGKHYFDQIGKGIFRMNYIVEGLLLLARVRNLENIDLTILDMESICKNAIERLDIQIKEREADIKFPPNFHKAYGYGVWVEEVWVNLLSNAVKYGGKKPEIKIGSKIENGSVHYSVSDNGIGMTDKELENVFMEFNSTNSKIKNESSHGLGLSIVKRIITKLGGQVNVSSIPNNGSTFSFSLPNLERPTPNEISI